MKHKKESNFDKALKEDIRIFKKHIEFGAKKLAGEKTKERVRNCYHCKVWNKAEKFMKEVLEPIKPSQKTGSPKNQGNI